MTSGYRIAPADNTVRITGRDNNPGHLEVTGDISSPTITRMEKEIKELKVILEEMRQAAAKKTQGSTRLDFIQYNKETENK